MRQLILLLGIVMCLCIASKTASACSCIGPGSACEAYGTASAVFVGTVVGLREKERPKDVATARREQDAGLIEWGSRFYKFSIEQPYLGMNAAEIEILTGSGGGDCGYEFKIGQRYLVYANRGKTNFTTSICSRTKPFDQADEDLAFLGTLSSAAPGATIYGRVMRYELKKEVGVSDPDVFITIEGEEKKEVRPDKEGNFRVKGLPPGKYKVKVHLPDTLTTYQPENQLTVADRGCAAQSWYVTDNGEVSGRVIDAEGQPVKRILLSLVKPTDNPRTADNVRLERTDEEGRFKFSAVARGSYLIAVNFNRYPDPSDPTNAYVPTFYPGVLDQAQAEVITVALGEKVKDRLIQIALRQPASVIRGQVVWADGTPVSNAQLLVRDATHREATSAHALQADAQGWFSINGYVGQQLVFQARSNRPYVPMGQQFDPMERSDPLRLLVQQPMETVKIVITKLR
jgi:hypothetical protein